MNVSKIMLTGAAGLALLGGSLSIAQQNLGHNDAPPGLPVKTTYDLSSLKYTAQEQKNIDLAVGYYRDCVQSHRFDLVDNFLAKDEVNHNPNDPMTPPGLM